MEVTLEVDPDKLRDALNQLARIDGGINSSMVRPAAYILHDIREAMKKEEATEVSE